MSEVEQEKTPGTNTPCPACTDQGICQACVDKLREQGIPERTLRWLQLSKEERIETVMF